MGPPVNTNSPTQVEEREEEAHPHFLGQGLVLFEVVRDQAGDEGVVVHVGALAEVTDKLRRAKEAAALAARRAKPAATEEVYEQHRDPRLSLLAAPYLALVHELLHHVQAAKRNVT